MLARAPITLNFKPPKRLADPIAGFENEVDLKLRGVKVPPKLDPIGLVYPKSGSKDGLGKEAQD